jgi:hypothetical protein
MLVQRTAGPDNIFIYAFDDLPVITNNLANWMDDHHYAIGVNRYMLKAIGASKHILTPDNVDAYLERVWQNRQYGELYYAPEHTVSFEGPVDEDAFSVYPLPYGPEPLSLSD